MKTDMTKYYFTCETCKRREGVTAYGDHEREHVRPPRGWVQRVNRKTFMHETFCPDCK